MHISVELTLSPLQDSFEGPIIALIKKLRTSGFKVIENPLSTQIYGEYDELMPFLNGVMKEALVDIKNGLFYMKIVKSDRSNYEPHF
ncbi:MAG: thiamine-binding protein [Eudoraea sp.]|nr:thiamine-binding protein [Eudoraea sp.]